MKRRTLILAAAAGGAGLGACAAPPPPPPGLPGLPSGRLLLLGPGAEFDPRHPPAGWSRLGPPEVPIATSTDAGRSRLSFHAPGGALLLRATDLPLGAWPTLAWSWALEAQAFGGGPGDGLRRGLRILVGCDGGDPGDTLFAPARAGQDETGLPRHRRRFEIAIGGTGATRPELAMVEVSVAADGGQRRILVPAAPLAGGRARAERAALRDLYRDAFPRDRIDTVRIVFVAFGALPARLPDPPASAIGHFIEVQLLP